MAACGSLRHLFERPLPENPTLMESLSWTQINAAKHAHDAAACAEIFGELHFEERRSIDCPLASAPASSPALIDRCPTSGGTGEEDRCRGEEVLSAGGHPRGGGDCCFSSLDSLLGVPSNNRYGSNRRGKDRIFPSKGRSQSLQLCTEGLGFESSDDVEDSRAAPRPTWSGRRKEAAAGGGAKRRLSRSFSEVRPRARGEFPPPISCIGSSGKPWVCLRSYREDGRFVLREVKIPTQELLRASREGGRLKLHFAQQDEEVVAVEQGGEAEECDGVEEGEVAEGGEEGKGDQEGEDAVGVEEEGGEEEIGVDQQN